MRRTARRVRSRTRPLARVRATGAPITQEEGSTTAPVAAFPLEGFRRGALHACPAWGGALSLMATLVGGKRVAGLDGRTLRFVACGALDAPGAVPQPLGAKFLPSCIGEPVVAFASAVRLVPGVGVPKLQSSDFLASLGCPAGTIFADVSASFTG